MGDAIEGAIAQDGLDLAALGGGAVLERVNDGHGGFAFPQVAGYGLAQYALRGGEVEHIVHDLESHAEVASVLAQALFLLHRGAAQHAADSHAHREQARRFAIDQIEMLLQRNQLAEFFHLEQFAFDHLLGQVDEDVDDAEIAFLHRDLERLHIEPVAGQHAH